MVSRSTCWVVDTAPGGALRADAGDVGADDVRAAVAQQLRQEARAAPGLEDALAGLDAARDHAQAVEVDLALRQLGPVMVVVVAQVHAQSPR